MCTTQFLPQLGITGLAGQQFVNFFATFLGIVKQTGYSLEADLVLQNSL